LRVAIKRLFYLHLYISYIFLFIFVDVVVRNLASRCRNISVDLCKTTFAGCNRPLKREKSLAELLLLCRTLLFLILRPCDDAVLAKMAAATKGVTLLALLSVVACSCCCAPCTAALLSSSNVAVAVEMHPVALL
jgi:hypothetical protein